MSDTKHEENLTAYLDGELSPDEVRALEAALEKDPALRATLASLKSAVAAVKALPEPAASLGLRRAVLAKVEGPQSFGERVKLFFTLPRLVPVAGIAAAAVVAVVTLRPGGDKPPADPEQLFVAQNMEMLEDLEVVLNLDTLEGTP